MCATPSHPLVQTPYHFTPRGVQGVFGTTATTKSCSAIMKCDVDVADLNMTCPSVAPLLVTIADTLPPAAKDPCQFVGGGPKAQGVQGAGAGGSPSLLDRRWGPTPPPPSYRTSPAGRLLWVEWLRALLQSP